MSLAVVLLTVAAVPADADGDPSTRSPAQAYDFNGDGIADLAAGIPYRKVAGAEHAGAVEVIYGSSAGLTPAHTQYLTQNSPGIVGSPNEWAFFGQSTMSGDFDGDGYADLATRASEDVLVVFGGPDGLTVRDQLIRVGTLGIEPFSLNGPPMTAADFDGDGFIDLVISGTGGEDQLGATVVLPGSVAGLATQKAVRLNRATPGVPGKRFPNDHFGTAIAVGDVTGDGFPDLALASLEKRRPATLHLFAGSSHGIGASQDLVVSTGLLLDRPSGPDVVALAIADFDTDGFGDLVVAAPDNCDDDTVHDGCGLVITVPGSATGFRPSKRQVWDQDSPGVPGAAESSDAFGTTIAVGDLNGDSHPDLAIGVPYERVNDVPDAGGVNVLYGSATGLTGKGAQFWSQRTPRIKGVPIREDDFSSGGLRILDVGRGPTSDLLVHSPNDHLTRTGKSGYGTVSVLYSSDRGVTTTNQLWHSNTRGLAGRTRAPGGFGGACC